MRRLLVVMVIMLGVSSALLAQDDAVEPTITLDHGARITAAAWSPDETRLLTAGTDGMMKTWDAETGDMLLEIEARGPVNGAIWRPDGAAMLTWTETGYATLWDAETGDRLYPANDPDMGAIDGALWSPEADGFLVWGESGNIIGFTYRTPDGDSTDMSFNKGLGAPVLDAALHDGRLLGLRQDGTLTAFEPVDWQNPAAVEQTWSLELEAETLGIDRTVNSDRLLSWGGSGAATIWALDGQGRAERLQTLEHSRTFVQGARWDVDETRVLSWGADETVRLWNADTGEQLFRGSHSDWVTGAVLDDAGSRVLSWAFNSARLWDVASGEPLAAYPHENLVSGAAFNADETQVLTWSWDGTARLWPLDGVSE